MPILLCLGVFLGGCDSSSKDGVASQEAPKNQTDGLNRLKEANIKHDETAPPNQKSGAMKIK